MNLNAFARKITLLEGKKVSLPISQIKEVISLVFKELDKIRTVDLVKLLKK